MSLGSQRASALFHKQVTVARQASLPGSPQVLRNPLLRQRRVHCYDANDASDEEEFDGEGDCISLPGALPGPSRPLTDDDTRHVSMASSKVMDVNKQERQPPKPLVSKACSVPLLSSSLDLQENVPDGMVDAPSRAASLLGSAEDPKSGPGGLGRKELSGSRSSPKLEYRVYTASTENPTSPQQKNENVVSRHKPVARVSPHCKRPEAEARLSGLETGRVNGPYDQDLQAQATSTQEDITGQPGGVVGKVTDTLFLSLSCSEYCGNQ